MNIIRNKCMKYMGFIFSIFKQRAHFYHSRILMRMSNCHSASAIQMSFELRQATKQYTAVHQNIWTFIEIWRLDHKNKGKTSGSTKMSTLSEAELARIARNREKARTIKSSKLCNHPYSRPEAKEGGEQPNNGATTKRYLNLFRTEFTQILQLT